MKGGSSNKSRDINCVSIENCKKMNKIYPFIAAVLILSSCEKRYELTGLDSFEVQLEKNSYSVGDTVRFSILGNPDNIVFWSGEDGHNYAYRKRTAIEGNTILLDFNSYSQYGEADPSTLKLLVSTDFSGTYDEEAVSAATWTDISDRAILSLGQDQTPSGTINLNEFATQNKDMVIAFRYKTTELKTSNTQNRWIIRTFNLKSVNEQGSESVLATMATAGWTAFNFSGASTFWTVSSAQLITARNFTELDDDWVVTKSFNPNAVTPDKGQAIKNISNKAADYTHVYTKAGMYKIVFVATNANVKHEDTILKEVEITVTD